MLPQVLRTLEFDRIVQALATFATTPMGAERLWRIAPSTNREQVGQWLAETSEAAAFASRLGAFPLRASAELPDALAALALVGRPLEAIRLLMLAAFLDSVEDTRLTIHRVAALYPRLDRVSSGAASFKGEIAQIRSKIDPSGEVVDHASPELKAIRDRLRRQQARLRGTLESYLRGKDTSRYLQELIVTERNGRFVLVVKAEHRSSIPGIVHGASTSGASLFLEPLSTVEINNDIVALEEQETEEVRRILLELTDAFRARPGDVQRTVRVATELDVIQARGRLSDRMDGVEPALTTDGAFELLAARHPLLMPKVLALLNPDVPGSEPKPAVSSSKGPVPVTLRILPPATILLITGPNTGGKTVALKTVGLLAMMAQAGLRIPVAGGSRVPVFLSIFADIGDDQSIEASLSTFSGHITNIAAMDRQLATPALVMLDEVGSGTDPVEGGALGVAVVDHFRRHGATLIATSHYDALKTYAATTEGVMSAAFGFDAETFAPTYQLVYGSPGRSLAIEIAARLGLNPSIVAAARQNLSVREAQLAEQLAQMDRDLRALQHEQRLAARARETLEAGAVRLREREDALKEREERARQRLSEELEKQVRQARREIDNVVASLKSKAAAMTDIARPQVVTTRETGAVRGDARTALDAVVRRFVEPAEEPAAPAPPERPAAVGDRVSVGALGLEATVTAIHDGLAELDLRGKRMRAQVRELRVLGGPRPSAKVNVHVELQPRTASLGDLNVIGCTVDEAITRAERFLDEVLLGDQRTVRFIHGHGTGQLKRALAGYLQEHPLVARFAAAPPEAGGNGVTVVELKD